MKIYSKLFFVGILSLFISSAYAQKRPLYTLYKEIQKVSQKPEQEVLHTVPSVGHPNRVISKDVHRASDKYSRKSKSGNMKSTGYPEWTISKGVHRIKKSKPEKDYKPEPWKQDVIVSPGN